MPAAETPTPKRSCRTHSAPVIACSIATAFPAGCCDRKFASLIVVRWVVKSLDQDGRKVFINICGSSRVSLPSSWQHGKVRCVDMWRTVTLSTSVTGAASLSRALAVRRVRLTQYIRAQTHPSVGIASSLEYGWSRMLPTRVATASAQMPAEAVQALQRLDRLDDGANEALRFPLAASEPREHPDHLGASATVIDCVFNASVVRRDDCKACHAAESGGNATNFETDATGWDR